MNISQLLVEGFGRVTELVHAATDGIDTDGLAYRPEPGANSIGWLVWHLTRVQDDHVSEIADRPQDWVIDGWAAKFDTSPEITNDGRGHGPADVAAISAAPLTDLLGYHHRVATSSNTYLTTAETAALNRIIDTNYDPPVTVGVRLVSVLSDNLQHAGQARYLHGIISRLSG